MKKTTITTCHYCFGERHQTRLFEQKEKVTVEDDKGEHITYMVLRCGGCGMISFLTKAKNPKPRSGEKPYIIKHFFHHMDDEDFSILKDKDYNLLPAKIRDLYDEVNSAFEQGLNVMAGTGLRTLVEAVCNHQQISGRTLQGKIQALHSKGFISAAELPILDKLRLMGNQSTHDIKAFSFQKLAYALDIINHVLISIYVLPKINRRLENV